MMALSKPKDVGLSLDLSVELNLVVERYFYMVFQKYGIAFPQGTAWYKEMRKVLSLNAGHTRAVLEVPNVLFEIVDLFENARVEELVKKCERLRLNSGNLYSHFTEIISTLLDNGITWGKVVMFFSFAVSLAIYLCTNEMSHLAERVCVWTAQDLRNRIQPWIDINGGWESLLSFRKEMLYESNDLTQKQAVKTLDQVSLMLGAFAVVVFAVKHVFL